MATSAKTLRGRPTLRPSLTAGIVLSAAVGAGVTAACFYAFQLTGGFALAAVGSLAAGLAAVAALARRHLPRGDFGAANAVTLLRGALIAPLIGLLGESPTAALAWFALALAIAALILDGIDGRLARGAGQASRFGARFDMETDALLILVLSALCWQFGKAGVWVLAAGLLRYFFIGAAALLPWMRAALPASRRRQTVCVVQIIALLVCLSPLFARPWSVAAAAIGLGILAWSFLVDVAWLARRA